MILHAQAIWHQAISSHLWPYALNIDNNNRNALPRHDTGVSPTEIFASVAVTPNLSHKHVFGCPVYALDDSLASGKSIPKWETRPRTGIYLGNSLFHARSVALVLNLNTGNVSPQFHVRVDDNFVTTDKCSGNPTANVVNWKIMAGLKRGVPWPSREETEEPAIPDSEGGNHAPSGVQLRGEPPSTSLEVEHPHRNSTHVSSIFTSPRRKRIGVNFTLLWVWR